MAQRDQDEDRQALAAEAQQETGDDLAHRGQTALDALSSLEQEDTVIRPTAIPPAPTDRADPVGYEILGELGRGGMGLVQKARHIALDRIVALKRLLGHAGPAEEARFRAEALAVARLRHPGIVQVFDVGEVDGLPYFAMEYLAAGSLADRLRDGPLEPRQAAGLLADLTRAVQAAHTAGVLHRDLKPSNILLGEDGAPRIADFGLARRLDTDSGLTRPGDVMGTPYYMAPEQAQGQRVGPAADLWSLGAILYECLTGRPPFRGVTVLETLDQVRTLDPVPPSRLQPRVPRALELICLKCLHKEAAFRYADAGQLAEELERFLAGRPLAHTRAVGPAERFWLWCRRNPLVAGLSLGLLLTLLAGLAGVTWKWRDEVAQRLRAEDAEAAADARAQAAMQAQKDTARALNYLAAAQVAGSYSAFSGGVAPLLRIGKRPEAIRSFQQLCTFAEQLRDANPSAPLDDALAKSYAQLGVLQAASGQKAEGLRSGLRGVELLRLRRPEVPDTLEEHNDLGQTAFVLGALLMHYKKFTEAALGFEESVSHFRSALAARPKDALLRKALSRSGFHLAHVLREAGQIERSYRATVERLALWENNPREMGEVFDAACEMALCAGRQPGGSASPYADHAVRTLRQAVQLGLKDASAIRNEKDFKALRERADFQALLAEVERRGKT
ncbi:MAG: serine/threonine-protein kinase [Gemmataceae bacterium]